VHGRIAEEDPLHVVVAAAVGHAQAQPGLERETGDEVQQAGGGADRREQRGARMPVAAQHRQHQCGEQRDDDGQAAQQLLQDPHEAHVRHAAFPSMMC